MSKIQEAQQEVEIQQSICDELRGRLQELKCDPEADRYEIKDLEWQLKDALQQLKHAEWELRRCTT